MVLPFIEFLILLLLVVDLKKKHPRHLLDTLCIAIDAGVVAHNVSDALNKISECHLFFVEIVNQVS